MEDFSASTSANQLGQSYTLLPFFYNSNDLEGEAAHSICSVILDFGLVEINVTRNPGKLRQMYALILNGTSLKQSQEQKPGFVRDSFIT